MASQQLGMEEGTTFARAFEHGFGMTEPQAAQKAQQIQAAKTMGPMVDALKNVKTPQDAFGVFSQNPAWLVNPQTGPFAQKLLQDYTNIAKAESATVEGKVKLQDAKDFSKALTEIDSVPRAKISAMPRNPDGTPTAQQWELLRQAQSSVVKPQSPLGKLQADRAQALARGDTAAVAEYDSAISKEKSPTAAIQNINQVEKWEDAARDADASGDPDLAKRLRDKATNLREQLKGNQMTVYDRDGNPIVTYGKGGAGDMTVGTKTQLQERLSGYESLNSTIEALERSLKPSHVGAAGVLGEVVFDKALAQLNPSLANKERIKTRELLAITSMEMLRKISNDNTGRWTTQDKAIAEDALVSMGALTSLPEIQSKLDIVKGLIQRRAQQFSGQMKTPSPLWSMSDEDLRSQFLGGKLTREQLEQEINRRYPQK